MLCPGMVSVPPDVVPGQPRDVWARDTAAPRDSGSALSISDVRLESRDTCGSGSSLLGTPARSPRLGSGRTPTPTWTEGTPSFTESSYSGDTAGECMSQPRGRARAQTACLSSALSTQILLKYAKNFHIHISILIFIFFVNILVPVLEN